MPNKKISINDADHPLRHCAIKIIEQAIEPMLNRGVDGVKYYKLEDTITQILSHNLKNKLE